MTGPLNGFRILEVGGQGTVPFTAMMLADLGAEVVRIERPDAVPEGIPANAHLDIKYRGRRNIAVDLKHPDGAALVLELVEGADALLEGYRPGVMERLGLGPDECLDRNPKLVFGRVTGWGQDGPWSQLPGHDINYVAFGGALAQFRREGSDPVPPLNLGGDLAGGGMLLAFGVVTALLEAQRSGQGQVVDAAMIDGITLLMSTFYGYTMMGSYDERRPGTHFFDTGAHFYNVYPCADGEYISIGCKEDKFHDALVEVMGLGDDPDFADQWDRSRWPGNKAKLRALFGSKTRDEWVEVMAGTDVCFAPVLHLDEVAQHPHNQGRSTYVEHEGVRQPAPVPRFSRTTAALDLTPAVPGQHTREVLELLGIDRERIDALLASGAVAGLPVVEAGA
ncbi:MAG: mcr [Actinomycetia bacterium]|nr:mcr [Actinomycetes bacterium]